MSAGSKRKSYVRWSEDKSEVYKPQHKVIFPGKRVVYCGRHDLGWIHLKSKEISEGAKDVKSKVAQPKKKYFRLNHESGSSESDGDSDEEYSEYEDEECIEMFVEEDIEEDEECGEEEEEDESEDGLDVIIINPKIPTKSNEARSFKTQDCKCAEAAIRFYNEKHATDYEIVETLGSYSRIYAGVYFHCNFRALRKSDADSGRPSKPNLFFAELYRTEPYTLIVNTCKMLDGPGPRPDIIRGCKICPGQLWHPVGGFKNGK